MVRSINFGCAECVPIHMGLETALQIMADGIIFPPAIYIENGNVARHLIDRELISSTR